MAILRSQFFRLWGLGDAGLAVRAQRVPGGVSRKPRSAARACCSSLGDEAARGGTDGQPAGTPAGTMLTPDIALLAPYPGSASAAASSAPAGSAGALKPLETGLYLVGTPIGSGASSAPAGSAALKPLDAGLYLVGTPIGNLEDITVRALRVLKSVALILAEDTRHSSKLLRHYGISKPMMSYHQFNMSARKASVLGRIQGGDAIALVSDAGMPAISDPGAELVSACIAAGIPVVPIPGPSAVTAAVAASGITSSTEFAFLGFPPEKPSQRRKKLQGVAGHAATQVLYAAPHKLVTLLNDCVGAFGPSRRCIVARELTKIHEEFWRGTLQEAAEEFEKRGVKGEITLVIEGDDSRTHRNDTFEGSIDEMNVAVEDRLRILIQSGTAVSESVRSVVEEFGVRRKEAYAVALQLSQDVKDGAG